MPASLPSATPPRLFQALRRLNAALLPDYNLPAAVYWWTMSLAGAATLVYALATVATRDAVGWLHIGAGVALVSLTALFPMRIPRTNQSLSAADAFIFLLLLMHGPAAGSVAATADSLVSSWRTSRRWSTRLGSAAIASVTMTLCGGLLELALPGPEGTAADITTRLMLAALPFGLAYTACSAVLLSAPSWLKRGAVPGLAEIVSAFGWVGGASVVSAAIAALLYIAQRQIGLVVMLAIVPIFGLLLTTLHFFWRQRQAEEAARAAQDQSLRHEAEMTRILARQREAEMAAQHLRDLETSERRFHSAFTHASIGMALVSIEGTIQLANPALATLLGLAEDELIDKDFSTFVDPSDRPRLYKALSRVVAGSAEMAPVELRCRRDNGHEVWASISCGVFSQPDSGASSLILQIQDVTARRQAEQELHQRAFHDKLTGLPNREQFHQALARAIEGAGVDRTSAFAVLYLDFDRFKLINDSKGHSAGDVFLVQASRRLAQCLRKGDMLARLGGDEFAILAHDLAAHDDAVEMAERLLQVMREPLHVNGLEITASASIGITFSSLGYVRPEDMLRDADIAMYRAKVEGKARYALFDVQLHAEVTRRVRLEGDLRQALAGGRLTLAYQPLHELADGRLRGFEALARWTHPELGPVSPAAFIPIAEDSGLIIQLTDYAIESACRQLHAWLSAHPGLDLCVHVNVAARDIADPRFVDRVRTTLGRAGLEPRHLVIELTENILMAQLSAAIDKLNELRDLGVGLSVDDFGTGYSSLSHLSMLPIDSLKIDRSFVHPLRAQSKEEAVIRAIVLLGKSLGKEVVAEGIETEAQMRLLGELGCDIGQGYHLARPLDAEAAGRMLQPRCRAEPSPQPAQPGRREPLLVP